jgi:RNA polymerase-binding protein DksA
MHTVLMETSRRVRVRVKPGARRTHVGGRYDGPHGPALVVAVTAPAVEGKATRAVMEAVAQAFGVSSRQVSLVSGERSRDKIIEVSGTLVEERLQELLDDAASADVSKSARRKARTKATGTRSRASSAMTKTSAASTTENAKVNSKTVSKQTKPEEGRPTMNASDVATSQAPDFAERASALVVRDDEDAWTAEELAEVHRELTADAKRLREELDLATIELADLLRDSGDGAGDDQAEVGSKAFEREHELSLTNNTRDLLIQTERALARIDDGTYGVCEGCGQPIGKARLLAFPRATLCVSCKQKEERH